MRLSDESFAASLWYETSAEAALPVNRLAQDSIVDVAVVGGGFTGASAALHLAEGGARVALFEAREIGFGASGRNGGQVIPGLKRDPDELVARFGAEQGGRLAILSAGAADRVFDLVERHGIACAPARKGWLQCAHAAPALATIEGRARQWQARGVPLQLLDAAEVRAMTGTSEYRGGCLDARAGTVQPLAYVRGLARAAAEAGAAIHQATPVRRLARGDGGWMIETEGGTVTAKSVVLATDAYSDDLWPGLKRSYLTVQSILIATAPLPAGLRNSVMPAGVCASETRKLAFYFRSSPDGRLVFGGRGAVGTAERDSYREGLERSMRRFFPQLHDVPVTHFWSGQVGLTVDSLIHLHEPEPGLLMGLGYNGRGIAMATTMGQVMARRILGQGGDEVPVTPIAPIHGYALRRPAMVAAIAYYWTKDRLGLAS